MAQKTATLNVRMDPEIKEQAEEILTTLGLSSSAAIQLFYKQIILNKGLPFSLVVPEENLDEDLDAIVVEKEPERQTRYTSDNSSYIIDDLE